MSTVLLNETAVAVEVFEATPARQYDEEILEMELALADSKLMIETFQCHCPVCLETVTAAGSGFGRMANVIALPEPQLLIDALEQTRAFVLDPLAPKVRRMAAGDSFQNPTMPCAANATRWCAIGYLAKLVGQNDSAALCESIARRYQVPTVGIWQHFDSERYHQSADALAYVAEAIRRQS